MIPEQLKAIKVLITWQQKCPVQWHVNQDWCLKSSPIMHQFKKGAELVLKMMVAIRRA